jgi:tripartite-type tricarboxylate transporter receptor subunit TctC
VTDVSGRLLAERLASVLGQPVIVENRAGAGGLLSFTAASEARPDGYLLAVATPATIALKVTSKAYTIDPVRDLTYVTRYVTGTHPLLLVAPTGAPYKTLSDFVSYARAHPGTVNFGSPGGQPDLDIASFAHAGGFKVTLVRYKGAAPIQQAIASGEAGAAIDAIGGAQANLDSNRARILAVTGPKRDPGFPNVPAISEAVSGFSIPPTWFGVIGPANMPAATVSSLGTAIKTAMSQPDLPSRLAAIGYKPDVDGPESFRAFAIAELDRLVTTAKLIGMEPE